MKVSETPRITIYLLAKSRHDLRFLDLAGVPFDLAWRFGLGLGFDAEAGSASDFTLPEKQVH